jgi:perosamine synthetase
MKVKKYKLQYSKNDIDFVKKEIEATLISGYLTDGGPNVLKFEQLWSKFNDSKYSIAVSNCTTGLECILRAINVENSSVVVPAYTFIASVMSIYNCKGMPIYADISKKTMSLTLESIKRSVRDDTKAVMIVHVGGVVTNEIKLIRDYCDKNNLFLIEDAACAHGAEYQGIKTGNFGHAACFSFHHSKVLTSGEGGIITTSDINLSDKIRKIRAIGLDRTINNYESFEIGSNSKMSEITAILAILHTNNAKKIIQERRKTADRYDKGIKDCKNNNIVKFLIPPDTISGYYKYFLLTSSKKVRDELIDYAKAKGIDFPPPAYVYTCDQQVISKKMNCVTGDNLINSHYMKSHNVCLPMYNGLTEQEIEYVITTVNEYVESKNGN